MMFHWLHILVFIAFPAYGKMEEKIYICPDGMRAEPQNWNSPTVFDGLSVREISATIQYMRSINSLGVKAFSDAAPNSTFIAMVERIIPRKSDVLGYLDNTRTQPKRFARVILIRGDLSSPVVEEYKVGPLPRPSHHEFIRYSKYRHPIPYSARPPYNNVELVYIEKVLSIASKKMEAAIRESTGGYTFSEQCGDKCLGWLPSGGIYKRVHGRSLWVYFMRLLEGSYLHPVGISLYLNLQSVNPSQWKVEKVWYHGQLFTLEHFVSQYKANRVDKVIDRPPLNDKNLYSSLNRRGEPEPEYPQRGPHSFMPDGRRFKLRGHHIDWLGWSLDYNIHTSSGPQIFDVRFRNERIAYEIGMQEVMVHYSGSDPVSMHTAYFDSGLFLGGMTNPLIPGVDCPDHAVYMDFAHYKNGRPQMYRNSACVFEHKDSVPLHRHYDAKLGGGYHYAHGMSDNYLIVRTVLTVVNYDYIADYIFRQNGAIEVRVSLSGYLNTNRFVSQQKDGPYSHQVAPNVAGTLHVHFVNYKVDLDILGESNRFATLNINSVEMNDPYHPGNMVIMNKFEQVLKSRELDAAYKFNFDEPKYLLFYNERKRNKFNNHRAYRLLPVNMAKSVIKERYAWENGATWIRYQAAVTRRRDSEPTISTCYHFFEARDPVVTLQDYIDDNEDITDQDLVTWVTLGSHHIPHTEDVPLTGTTGMQLHFFLLPYNYFDEDPSMASRDNIRMTPEGPGNKFDFSGNKVKVDCAPVYPGDPTQVRMLRAGSESVHAHGQNIFLFALTFLSLFSLHL